MSQLLCEICEGKNIVKHDGVFVCQTCGIKYSVEEARRMIEGVARTTGAVQTDNSVIVQKFLDIARSAFTGRNFQEAYQYTHKVLEIDPYSSDAWYLKMLIVSQMASFHNPRLEEIITCGMNAVTYAPEAKQSLLRHNFYKFCLEQALSSLKTSTAIMSDVRGLRESYGRLFKQHDYNTFPRAKENLAESDREIRELFIPASENAYFIKGVVTADVIAKNAEYQALVREIANAYLACFNAYCDRLRALQYSAPDEMKKEVENYYSGFLSGLPDKQTILWKRKGLCHYCGGKFSLFGNKCKPCGKVKGY